MKSIIFNNIAYFGKTKIFLFLFPSTNTFLGDSVPRHMGHICGPLQNIEAQKIFQLSTCT